MIKKTKGMQILALSLAAALKRLDKRNEQSGSQTCYKKYSNARF